MAVQYRADPGRARSNTPLTASKHALASVRRVMPDTVASHRNRLFAALFWLLVVSAAVLATGNDARAQMGLSGIDVSNWQRQIDWVAVAGTGNSFVFAKA